MGKIIALILVLTLAGFSHGQHDLSESEVDLSLVIGVVKNKDTQEPIEGVKVNWEGNTTESVLTDNDGVYKIKLPWNVVKLIFHRADLTRLEVDPSKIVHGELNVEMYEGVGNSITASRWAQNVDEIPASIVIIDRAEIEEQGYLTVQEILENVTGMYTVDNRSPAGVTIGIRGFWTSINKNVMIQVNGVNMISGSQNEFKLQKINIPVEAIDKIEIVRGPMAVMYGTGAFFGVVNIITNNQQSGANGTIAFGAGTQATNRMFGRYTVKIEDFEMSLNMSYNKRNGFNEQWNSMISDSMYQADQLINNGSQTAYSYKDKSINADRYSRIHHGVNFHAKYKGVYTNVNYARSDVGFSFSVPGPGERNGYFTNGGVAQIGYIRPMNDWWTLEVKADYSRYTENPEYRYFDASEYVTAEIHSSSLRGEINSRIILLKSHKKEKFDLDLIVGGYMNRNLENFQTYSIPTYGITNYYAGLPKDENLDHFALYAQNNLKIKLEKITIQGVLGGRIAFENDYNLVESLNEGLSTPATYNKNTIKASGIYFLPRAAFICQFNQNKKDWHHFARLMYGRAINHSTLAENLGQLGTSTVMNNTVIEAKEDQLLRTYEVGYSIVNQIYGAKFNMNFFRNDVNFLVNNSLVLDSVVASNEDVVTNGAELLIKGRFRTFLGMSLITFRASLSASLQVTSDENSSLIDHSVAFSPQFLSTVKVAAYWKKFSLGLNVNYVSAMKSLYRSVDPVTNVTTLKVGESYDPYFRCSINLRCRNFLRLDPSHKGFYVNCRIANLFNKQYQYPTFASNSWADKGMNGRGRQIVVSLGYKF
ncbi:MAG: TonB-dependent receptor plug domain-containing protein [Crocinitomicaceae bacterium]|nr:TonB-dependent receptor plug domain-containing protein [Crocinitomicaceae bacterium]